MDGNRPWPLPAQPSGQRNGEVHARRVLVGDSVDQECRLMRKCDLLRPLAGASPQNRLTILSKPIRWILCDSIDPSGHSLQPAALCETNQDGIFDSQSAGLF
jgi:hypothetical protein